MDAQARALTGKEVLENSLKELFANQLTDEQIEQFMKKKNDLRDGWQEEKDEMENRHRNELKELEDRYKGYERDAILALINGKKI